MKITEIGRARPILYRGKFNVPKSVVSRLAVSQNHLILAETANFNARVDQFYLAIDNALSALIMAKEGILGTTNHRKKIEIFFKYFSRRARIRSISKDDFDRFRTLWSKSRYRLYFPSSILTFEMGLFASHLYDFVVTEISRIFGSDEIIVSEKVGRLLRVHGCDAILEECSHIHEMNQTHLEGEGEACGRKLELKLLNPWNYVRVSLFSDHERVATSIDSSRDMHLLLRNCAVAWDKLIKEVIFKNIEQIGLDIANAKLRKKQIVEQQAIEEAIEAYRDHPETLRFRLTMNFSYDSMSAEEELSKWTKIIAASIRIIDQHPRKAHKSAWENYRSTFLLKRERKRGRVRDNQ
jgi:hypothetical protein